MKTLFNNHTGIQNFMLGMIRIKTFFLGLIIFFIFVCFQSLIGEFILLPHKSELQKLIFFAEDGTLILDKYFAKSMEIVIPFSGYIFIGSVFLTFLIVYVFIRLRKKSVLPSFNLHMPKKQTILLYLHHLIILSLSIACIELYFPGLLEEPFSEMAYRSAHSKSIFFIAVVLFAPFFEEFVFRGLMFDGLKEKFGVFAAIIIPALLFALAHWGQYGFWICFLAVLPMGILFGYARLKSNTLTLPIALHLINNLTGCLLFEFY